jgi:hypothetical protein
MADVVYRLTWFELEVCPQEFRFAVVPGQPVLIGVDNAVALVQYEGNEATYERIVDSLDELVQRWQIFETEMNQPGRAFEEEKAMSRASLHFRVAYGDDRRWASMYPLSRVPANVRGLLTECQQMARDFSRSAHSQEISGETALSLVQPAERPRPPAVIARVKVTRTGQLFLNGQPTSLEELVRVFARLKHENGGVWYYREDPAGEPPAEAMAVIQAVADARLPIKLCETDFDSPDDTGEGIFARPE